MTSDAKQPFKLGTLSEGYMTFIEARVCYAVSPGFYAVGIDPDSAFEALTRYAGARTKKEQKTLRERTTCFVLPKGVTHHAFNGMGGVGYLGASGPSERYVWNNEVTNWCKEE